MNKSGQVMFYTLMVAVVVIIIALSLAAPLKHFTEISMNESSGDFTGLNCSTTTNDFTKGTCILTDMYLPYFIGALIAIGGAFVGAKIIFSE